jgi:hypothetical protein
LGGVVHEALRLLSPVQGTIREAGEDVVIPLGTPVRGRDGQMIDSVKVSKGSSIFLRQSLSSSYFFSKLTFQLSASSTPLSISGDPTPKSSSPSGTAPRKAEWTRSYAPSRTLFLGSGAISYLSLVVAEVASGTK